jgi:RNA polymerase sigma factor (sigma-70 family)
MFVEALGQLPLEARCALILEAAGDDFESALQALRSQGLSIPTTMTHERLAWAVAFNVLGAWAQDPDAQTIAGRGASRGYKDHWAGDTDWSVIWSTLVKIPGQDKQDPTTLLAELALSVACEQRDDWQNAAARPLSPAEADRAFEFVYRRDRRKVIGEVFSRFGNRAGNPEVIGDEAWSRVFCDYWSVRARRRFLGLSRISTLVCQVAHYVAYDQLRQAGQISTDEGESEIDVGKVRAAVEGSGAIDSSNPESRVLAGQLHSRVKECLASATAKQQVVATMVWIKQLPAKHVAQILGISEPAVSQHLKKARDTVRMCLRKHGFDF